MISGTKRTRSETSDAKYSNIHSHFLFSKFVVNMKVIIYFLIKQQMERRDIKAQLPQDHIFDFKVKVNYQNGGVTLLGPNAHSPLPINFNQPIKTQRFINAPHTYQSSSHIQHYTQSSGMNQNYNMKPYSVQQPIYPQRQSFISEIKCEESTVECVICEKSFTSSNFSTHLELHRKRIHDRNHENSKSQILSQSSQSHSLQSGRSNQSMSESSIEIIHGASPLYSFQQIGDSVDLQRFQAAEQVKNQQKIMSSLNSSGNYCMQLERQKEKIVPQGFRESNKSSVLSQNEKMGFTSPNKNSSEQSFSQQYLQQIIEKSKNKEHRRFQSEQGNQSFKKVQSLRAFQSMRVDISGQNLSKQNTFEKNSSFKEDALPQSKGNPAINLRKNIQSLLHSYDSKQNEEDGDSSISSIDEVKQGIQNLSRDQLIQIYHSNHHIKSQSQCGSEPSRPKRPSERIIKERNTQGYCPIRKSESFLSEQYFQQNKNIEKPMSVENFGIHSRQIFRGVQVDETQIMNQTKKLNQSYISKSSKTSTKSKLPKNYFAANDLLERSGKH